MDKIKLFNKKIILTTIATLLIFIGGIFGFSKIYAEGDSENKTYYNEDNMHKSDDIGYIPIELEQKVFELTDLNLEVEGDDNGSIEEGGDAYISLTLKIVDSEIINLIENGKKLKYDFSFAGIHSEKIKLKEINTFKFKMGFMVHGMGLDQIFEENELDVFFEKLFGFYDLAEQVGSKGEQAIDFTYYIGLRVYEGSDNKIREIDMPLPIDQYAINYYSNNSILEASDEDFESGINFKKFLNGNSFIEGERLRVDNGFLEVDGYEDEDIEVKYNISFVDGFGNIIESQEVIEGELPTAPTNIIHPENSEKYKFMGWDKDIEAATEDTTYTAVFEINKFVVEFYDDEGKLIESQEIEYGTDAISPSKNLDKKDRWFKAWDSNLENITENKTITAIYEMKEIFTINFKNLDGSMIQTLTLYEGDLIDAPKNVEHPENEAKYKFTGWDQTIDETANKDVDYIAEFEINKFEVKFLDLKGKVIDTQVVEYGESAVYPDFNQETIDRVLTGWEGSLDNITSNQSFKATFETKDLFFITFKNIDGSIIEVLELYKGQTIKAPLATFISDNELFEYVFVGWDKELDEVAERNIEYTAQYEITKRFRVIFKNSDGSIISEEIYLEDDLVNSPKNVEHPTQPEKYKFLGFTPNFKPVAEDTEYIAVYEVRSFRVRFYFDNKLLNTQTILYGENATSPSFEIENVTFKGWDKEFRNITENTDVFAIYEENQSYEITIKVNGKLIETIKLYESIYQLDISKYLNQNKNYNLVEVLDFENNNYIVEEGKIVILDGLFENYEINILMELKDTYKVTYIHFDGTEEIVEVYEGDLAPKIKPTIKDMIFVGWINSETLEFDDLKNPVNSDLKYHLDYKERDLTLDVPIFEKEDAVPGFPWKQNFTIKKPGAGIDNYKNHQVLFAMDGIEDFDEIVYITVTIKHTYRDGGGGIYFPGFEGTRKGFYVYKADKDFSIRYLKNPGEFKDFASSSFGWLIWITGSEVKEYTKPAENISGWGDGYIMNNMFAVETEFMISFATKSELDKKPEHPDLPGEEIPGNDDQSFLDKVIEFVKKYIGYIIFILITVFILNLVSSKIRKNNRNRKRNKKKIKKKRR